MHLSSLLAFAAAMFVLAVTPGPGVFAVTARSLSSGLAPALAMICGVVLGDLAFLLLAVYGLAWVADILNEAFLLVRYAGAAYLIWLGTRLLLSRPSSGASPRGLPGSGRSGLAQSFAAGFAITLGNPKVILFYLGFLPTFLDLRLLAGRDVAAVAGVMAGVLIIVMAGYALLADRARRLATNALAVRRMNQAAGGVMIATGAVLAARS